jgi:hypothetical protein
VRGVERPAIAGAQAGRDGADIAGAGIAQVPGASNPPVDVHLAEGFSPRVGPGEMDVGGQVAAKGGVREMTGIPEVVIDKANPEYPLQPGDPIWNPFFNAARPLHFWLLGSGGNFHTRAQIAEHYAAFLVPMPARAFTIDVRSEPGAPYLSPAAFREWQIRSTLRAGRLEFLSFFEKGWVDWATGQGALVLRTQGNPENFLRVVYAWRCLEGDALLLHASGIIRDTRGYVFFGPSGSGKTTITRLSQAHTVLSDDLVILKKQDARWRVHGVPFRGDLPEAPRTNAAADLRGIFALAKDSQHRVLPLPPPEAVARLSACVPFVMAQPGNAQRVTGICAGLNASVPVRALHFDRDSKFWEVIDGLE